MDEEELIWNSESDNDEEEGQEDDPPPDDVEGASQSSSTYNASVKQETDATTASTLSETESSPARPVRRTEAIRQGRGVLVVSDTESAVATEIPNDLLTAQVEIVPSSTNLVSSSNNDVVTARPPLFEESLVARRETQDVVDSRCSFFLAWFHGRYRWWEILAVFVALVATVTVIVVVVLVLGDRSGSSSSEKNNNDQQEAKPPNGMTREEYLADIRRELLGSSSQDPTSPRVRATEWLAFEDTLFLEATSRRLRQRYALLVIYLALGGEQGGFLAASGGGWTELGIGVHECEWTFVECDDENETVTGLVMVHRSGEFALSGTLSADIALLTSLKRLGLANNRLDGPLPIELYDLDLVLTNQACVLKNNVMRRAEYLDLSTNQFTSTISSDIGRLEHLEYLDVQFNWFSGELPSEMQQLRQLTTCRLGFTNLVGPLFEYTKDWTQIREIDVAQSLIHGSFPTEIGVLSTLKLLKLNLSKMGGVLPTEMGLLNQLNEFVAGSCRFHGAIPDSIGNCSKLHTLWLEDNDIEGRLPTTLGLLRDLRFLNTGLNEMTGPIPTEMGNFPDLISFIVSENSHTGTVPSELGKLTSARRIFLSYNQLEGEIPVEVCDLGEAQFVNLLVDCEEKVSCPRDCCTQCF